MNVNDTALRHAVRGRVLLPGDDGFERARRPWNLAVDQPVRAVVEVEDPADAAAVVSHARLAGLGVAVQPSGHGAARGLDGQILVRTGRMREVRVDPDARVARVEAGAGWGEVLTATAKYGLAAPAGSSPVVNAAGYTLGGGLSWFGRHYGFAANGVRALEIIDAEGTPARVTAESDPELFWALRGGGGDFALVTAIEFALFAAPHLHGGRMLWPIDRAGQVLDAFREITAQAPPELSMWFTLLQFPPFPTVPEPLRGLAAVAVDHTFLGPADAAAAFLRPLASIGGRMLDTGRMIPVSDLGTVCAEPVDPAPALFSGQLLTELGDACADTVLSAAGRSGIAPLVSLQIRHLGGALARTRPGDGACGHIAEPYLLNMIGIAPGPDAARQVADRFASVERATLPYTSGRKPFTFLGAGEKAAAAFPGETLARLRDIKRRRDPHGVFHSNFPVLA